MSHKNICIIPARGGSKRIPKKNIADFHGRPLISYTIDAAIKSGLFDDQIYISSDSDEILAIADKYPPVRKIKRPDEISGDNALLETAALHLLKTLGAENYDYICTLMPNCPLRTEEDVIASYNLMREKKADCIMSVIDYHWLYPFWVVQEKEDERIGMFFGDTYMKDSKELPQNVYCPSGAVRWLKVDNFMKEQKYWGKNLVKYEIPFERGADIDTHEDLELAKKMYHIAKKSAPQK